MRNLTLNTEISQYFPNYASHIVKNLLIVVWSIFESKTTNLNKAKDQTCKILENGKTVEESSNYMRLIRFFKTENPEELVKCILTVCCIFLKPCPGKSGPKYLVLDGTEWEIGNESLQFLTLCILWNGVAIPIWWEDLKKMGHSSQEERKKIITNALKRYDLKGMVLLADREYIGEDWFSFLRSQGIDFVIRLKAGIYHEQVNACKGPRQSNLERKARSKKLGQCVYKPIEWNGNSYLYIITKNIKQDAKEPLVYLLTSLNKPDKALRAYRCRWKIETCFKHLKSNGFDLEAMNVKGTEKRNLMMAIVVFLYVLAVKEGFLFIQAGINAKKHYKVFKKIGITTLAISFFRKGVSLLHRKIANFKELLSWLTQNLKAFYVPPWCHV